VATILRLAGAKTLYRPEPSTSNRLALDVGLPTIDS